MRPRLDRSESMACKECGLDPVCNFTYQDGFRLFCMACGKSTEGWWRLADAELEWRQVTNGSCEPS